MRNGKEAWIEAPSRQSEPEVILKVRCHAQLQTLMANSWSGGEVGEDEAMEVHKSWKKTVDWRERINEVYMETT